MRRAALDPDGALQARFRALQPVLADSAYGRSVGMAACRSPHDLRALPRLDSEGLRSWVDRIAAGEPGVLTRERVDLLERTGGSVGDKLVPYTARLRAEFAFAVGAWMVDLHRAHPRLIGTRQYWSISRVVRAPERSAGGIPIGLESDADYLGPLGRRVVSRLFAVPDDVARAPTLSEWRARTLDALLRAEDLGLISVWSPTFLLRLLAALDEPGAPSPPVAAARLRAYRRSGQLRSLWPRLQVVSAWGDAFARRPFRELASRGPTQAKGLLATEGVVSVPLGVGPGTVVIPAHVVELARADGSVCWPHEAELGGRYQPLLTTGGGLVRYALPDEVEVVGFWGRLPRIRLVGRLDRGSDLVGEKLTSPFVQAAIEPLGPGFFVLLPDRDRYVLISDRPVDAVHLDARLRAAHHYAWARDLGQLRAPEVQVLREPWTHWERAVEASGLRLGDQKPSALEPRPGIARQLLASISRDGASITSLKGDGC